MMITIQKIFNPLLKAVFKKPSTAFGELFVVKQVRYFATEEKAVQDFYIRRIKKPRLRKPLDGSSWFLLIIPVSAFGLGTWQVFRLFEKEEFNKKFLQKIDVPPIELPKNLEELQDLEYRKIRVKGKFDHSKEIYFGPRAKIDEESFNKISSLISRSRPGYQVITPFTLSDRNLTILVNRGWVPADKKLPHTRPEGQVTDEVEILGVVRLNEKRQPFGGKNDPNRGVWIYRDIDKMSEVTGAAPVFLDADLSTSVPGGPIGGQTIIGLPNQHLSYIYTWYGLSAASSYLWYQKYFQKVPIIV